MPMSIPPPSGFICRHPARRAPPWCWPPAAAAGLEAITVDRPKVMLPIAGKPLLRWLIDGFKKETSTTSRWWAATAPMPSIRPGIKLVVNERYAETGELASLACAIDALPADTVISYGDLLFRSYVLRDLVEIGSRFCRGRRFFADRCR
jgi:phosphoenolpyruvate phosphomutase